MLKNPKNPFLSLKIMFFSMSNKNYFDKDILIFFNNQP
jgi:hypothetical protein